MPDQRETIMDYIAALRSGRRPILHQPLPANLALLAEEAIKWYRPKDRLNPESIWGPGVGGFPAAPDAPTSAATWPNRGLRSPGRVAPPAAPGTGATWPNRGLSAPSARQASPATPGQAAALWPNRAGTDPRKSGQVDALTGPAITTGEPMKTVIGEWGGGPPVLEPTIADMLKGVGQEPPEAGTTGADAQALMEPKPDRLGAIKKEEDEVNMLIALSEAFGRIGSSPTADEILLGVKPREMGPPAALKRKSETLAARRGLLEARGDLPEWDPKSDVSKTARKILGDMLGMNVPEGISAGDIEDRFGKVGTLFAKGEELKLAKIADKRLPNDIVKQLGEKRIMLGRLANLERDLPKIEKDVGPFVGRWNTFIRTFGGDKAEATRFMADNRAAFLKLMYGEAGKQLSDPERKFWMATVGTMADNRATFKELLYALRERQFEDYKGIIASQHANRRDIKPHILPGWEFDETEGMRFPTQPVKLPSWDKKAIRDAQNSGQPYEVIDDGDKKTK